MTPDDLRDAIRRRAGIRQRQVPVRILDCERLQPPTLRRRKVKGKRNTEQREVVVSASWLYRKAPKLWAAYCAGYLLGLQDRLTISYREDR